MFRILTEPEYNLIKQQVELMKTEKMEITFPEQSIREIARLATEINRSVENIGARYVGYSKYFGNINIHAGGCTQFWRKSWKTSVFIVRKGRT